MDSSLFGINYYGEYLAKYPNGIFAEEARKYINSVKIKIIEKIEKDNDIDTYQSYKLYLISPSKEKEIKYINKELVDIINNKLWEIVKKFNSIFSYNEYIELSSGRMISGLHLAEAKKRVHAINKLTDRSRYKNSTYCININEYIVEDKLKNCSIPTICRNIYINSLGTGKVYDINNIEVESCIDNKLWELVEKYESIKSYREYIGWALEGKIVGLYFREAKERIDNYLWRIAQDADSISSYNSYLQKSSLHEIYGLHADDAKELILVIKAKRFRTVEDYQEYLRLYPNGIFSEEAESWLESLNQEQSWFNSSKHKHTPKGTPYDSLGNTFKFTCTNGYRSISYAVELLPKDTYKSLRRYGEKRCAEESSSWHKLKGTRRDYKFSTKQFYKVPHEPISQYH